MVGFYLLLLIIKYYLELLNSPIFSSGNSQDLFKYGMQLMKKRELGLIEACDRLFGHSLFNFDFNCMFLSTDKYDKRIRSLKPKYQIELLKLEGDQIFRENFLDHYYPKRSKELQNFSLFNIFINFE